MIKEIQAESKSTLPSFLKQFKDLSKNPEQFLSAQPKKVVKVKEFLKLIYDFTYGKDDSSTLDILPSLTIEEMDDEQIWQQLEIKNNALWKTLLAGTSKLLSIKNDNLKIKISSAEDENKADEIESAADEDEENVNFFDESENEANEEFDDGSSNASDKEVISNTPKPKINIKPSVVDDKFFKLSELEAFLNIEDKKEMQKLNTKSGFQNNSLSGGDEIDYFAETNSESEAADEENINYVDFFDQDSETEETNEVEHKLPNKNRNKQAIEDDINTEGNDDNDDDDDEEASEEEPEEQLDGNLNGIEKDYVQDSQSNGSESDDNDDVDKPKSSYEERQARLRERIDEYEEKALGEKPWQLKGEVAAASRPHNSVLAEILEFDSSTRPAPVITEEVNISIESIICQRIKDKAWDDVVRTVRPVQSAQEFRKTLILDQEKSKMSLAQIYEKDYQNEIDKINPLAGAESEEEPKSHKEIKQMMAALFKKLDALSNFHFTPKPVAPEPKIITNTPAVNMEEVAPLAMSEAKLLAPEEIKSRSKGNTIGDTERTKTDKNRDRRHKKLRQKAIFKAKEDRDLEKQKAGIPISKKEDKDKMLRNVIKSRNVSKVNESLNGAKAFKSSKSFFTQMQDKSVMNQGKRKPDQKLSQKNSSSAKKLKL